MYEVFPVTFHDSRFTCSRITNYASIPAAYFPPFEPFDFPHRNLASGVGHAIPVESERSRRARRADDLAAVVTKDFEVIGAELPARDDRGIVIDHFIHVSQGDSRDTHRRIESEFGVFDPDYDIRAVDQFRSKAQHIDGGMVMIGEDAEQHLLPPVGKNWGANRHPPPTVLLPSWQALLAPRSQHN